jgi:hypothetical protein
MKSMDCAVILCLACCFVSCAQTQRAAPSSTAAGNALLDIQGHKIWAQKEGAGDLTVFFEIWK